MPHDCRNRAKLQPNQSESASIGRKGTFESSPDLKRKKIGNFFRIIEGMCCRSQFLPEWIEWRIQSLSRSFWAATLEPAVQ